MVVDHAYRDGKPQYQRDREQPRIKLHLHPAIKQWVDRLAWERNPRDPRRAKADVVSEAMRLYVARQRETFGPEHFEDMPPFPPAKRWRPWRRRDPLTGLDLRRPRNRPFGA